MKKPTDIILVLLSAVILSGCFIYNPVAEFAKQRYRNTVAYFNTFYNAQRAFNEAEEEMLQAQKEFNQKPVPGKAFVIPSNAKTKFTSSIEKNSKLLSFYPESKWVDDALMMIGKAYFYLGDQLKAERKFLELMAKFPDGGLVNESKLLLGKCYLLQKKIESGIKQLDDLIAATIDSDEEIAGKAAYELAEYYFGQGDFQQAEKHYMQALSLLSDESQKAFVQFKLGQCYENMKQFQRAEEAYSKVGDYSPEYSLYFSAEIARLKCIVQQQRFDEAIESLETMLDDAKNSEYYGSIHLEIADALYAQGKLEEAVKKYQFIDTSFVRTEESARSYFALAKIYEDSIKNYDSARVYYNKAKLEFTGSSITPEATVKAEIFTKYDNLKKDFIRFDSLLFSALNKKNEDDDSLHNAMADSVVTKDTLQTSIDDSKIRRATRPGKKTEAKRDSLPAVDSAKITLKAQRELAQKQLIDSLQRSIVRTKFEIGGLFFLELQLADSALYWLHDVAYNHPQSEFAARSLFSIAEIYRTLQPRPQQERDSIYWSIITKYPASPYAQEARKNLGLPLVKEEADSASILYEKAELLSDANNYSEAMAIYQEIVQKYSASPVTPKALYAMGWYFENTFANSDSAVAIYKRLVGLYPSSSFAAAVRPKVTEYDNEQKRIEQEKKKQSEEQKLKESTPSGSAQKEKVENRTRQSTEFENADSLSTPKTKLPKIDSPKTDSLSTPNREI